MTPAADKRLAVVAMSGGVDSSVAAALLVEEGWEVVGINLRLADDPETDGDRGQRTCCAPEDVDDVRRVAERLGIPYYVANYREVFEREVIDPFVHAYAAGRTPNPCIACNVQVKFDPLLRRARGLGAQLLATGHYARVTRDAAGRYHLHRGRDAEKDQTYFLHGLGQEELAFVRFPLGDLDKGRVRALAAQRGLSTAEKPESQEICFVGSAGYAATVESRLGPQRPGALVHLGGRVLGRHEGLHRFTVGQRRGLGVGSSERLYVVHLDRESGAVTVGPREALSRSRLTVSGLRFVVEAPSSERVLTVCVRYRDPGVPGRLVALDGASGRIELDSPVSAAAPGQAVVLYDGDEVVGGGTLEEAA